MRATDFVGRAADLDELRRRVDDAVAGAGSVLLVAGEAGIGKTRLAEEAAAYAEAAGAGVRRGAGWEGGGAPAYWPWIQIVRAHAAHRDLGELARELGAGAPDILRLTPELADDGSLRAPAPDEPDGEHARFRMFDAMASFLRRAGGVQPLVVLLDDLHWADTASLLLLRFCIREARDARLLVLGTFRDVEVEPSSDTWRALAELQHDAPTLRIGGLSPDEVRELLAPAIGPHEAQRLAADVHRRSGGNPLFVRELGRLLAGRPPEGLGSAAHVPDSIRAVLDRRLFKLPPECLEVLRIAAAAGEEFRADILVDACGRTRTETLELLDHAVRARLLVVRDVVGTRFAFTHALVRDALYEQLPLAERAVVHRRIGEALERAPGADPPLGELAHHFLRADPPRGADYAERAGRRSLEQLAYEDAATHFARALEALHEPDDERRTRLWLALGEARLRAGDAAEAATAFEAAAALARHNGRPDLLAETALAFGSGLSGFEVRLLDRAQIDLLEEALRSLDAGDSSLRAWTMARLSIALTFAESEDRRRDLAAEAIDMARRLDDPRALAYALAAHCDAIAGPDQSQRRLEQSSEMVRLSIGTADRVQELLGRRHRLIALLELGDVPAVDAEIEAFETTARSVREPLYLWYVPMWRGMRALMDGRAGECDALTAEMLRVGERAHSDNAVLLAEVLRWNMLRAVGRVREAADVLREQLKLTPGIYGEPFWLGLIAPAEFPEEAKTALARLAPSAFAELPRDAVWLGCMSGVVDACNVVRDTSAAQTAYDLLLPYHAQFSLDGTATACYGSVSRDLGLLAGVLGRFEDAARHFEDALAANRRAGATALVAETLAAYGAMLLQTPERTRGERVLGEAASIFRELGWDLRADRLASRTGDRDVQAPNVFRRDGEFWTLTYAGRTARLKDAKGLRDIATLLARQGADVHVADLISEGASAVLPGDTTAEPLLDEHARAAYRRRLAELREELDEAEQFSDIARAERARLEMDALAGELASALGLGGRARRAGNPVEQARKAVAQRVRNSMRRIDAAHPALGRHLDTALRMGTLCSYAPEHSVDWVL
jgi:tetratricopeptide (TPR) repeat protein